MNALDNNKIFWKLTRRSLCLLLAAFILVAPCGIPGMRGAVQAAAQKTSGNKTAGKKSSGKKTSRKKSSGQKRGQVSRRGETSADVRKQHDATQQEIRRTERQIKENDAAVGRSLGELGRLQGDIDVSRRKVAEAGAKVGSLKGQMTKLQTQIAAEEKSLATLRAEYLKAVRQMRVKRKGNSTLAFVFSSGSFNEALRRMRYLKQFSEWRGKQTGRITAKVASLRGQAERLAQTKKMYDRELAAEMKARDELQGQYDRQGVIVADLKKNGDALKSHLAKKQSEANALRGRVATLIAEETRKAEAEEKARRRAEEERLAKAEAQRKAEAERLAKAEADKKAREERDKLTAQTEPARGKPQRTEQPKKPEQPKKSDRKHTATVGDNNGHEVTYAEARRRRPKKSGGAPGAVSNVPSPSKVETQTPKKKAAEGGGSFESMRGALPRPVAGAFQVTSRFGNQSLPDMPGVSYDNPGIDALVNPGASAQAVYAGKVSGVYMVPGYSTVVIVSHGGYYTVYGNIESPAVKVGDNVRQGQALGRLAAAEEDSSHSSIHFEVWRNRDKQDPLKWIR